MPLRARAESSICSSQPLVHADLFSDASALRCTGSLPTIPKLPRYAHASLRPRPRQRLYAGRVAGRHCHHRRAGRAAACPRCKPLAKPLGERSAATTSSSSASRMHNYHDVAGRLPCNINRVVINLGSGGQLANDRNQASHLVNLLPYRRAAVAVRPNQLQPARSGVWQSDCRRADAQKRRREGLHLPRFEPSEGSTRRRASPSPTMRARSAASRWSPAARFA